MKKRLMLLISCLMVGSFIFCGCSSDNKTSVEKEENVEESVEDEDDYDDDYDYDYNEDEYDDSSSYSILMKRFINQWESRLRNITRF